MSYTQTDAENEEDTEFRPYLLYCVNRKPRAKRAVPKRLMPLSKKSSYVKIEQVCQPLEKI